MQNTEPKILGDMFNYYNACGVVSVMIALYYNNDFREKVENFYTNQTDENLSTIFSEIVDPRLKIDWNKSENFNQLKEKQKEIIIAFRNFWHAHLDGDELCSPFGKIWAFNRLAEALELPRRMYVPSTMFWYNARTKKNFDKLISECKDVLKKKIYNSEKIKTCNNLWRKIQQNLSNEKPELNQIFTDKDNMVYPNKQSIISQFYLSRLEKDVDKFETKYNQQNRAPGDILNLLMSLGVRFNLKQYDKVGKEEENNENGAHNCLINNYTRAHHQAFITLNDNKRYFYDLAKKDALEKHILPVQRTEKYQNPKGGRMLDLTDGFKFFEPETEILALSRLLKPERNLEKKINEHKTEVLKKQQRAERKTRDTVKTTTQDNSSKQKKENLKLSYNELEAENKSLKQKLKDQKEKLDRYYRKALAAYNKMKEKLRKAEDMTKSYEVNLQKTKKQYGDLYKYYNKLKGSYSQLYKYYDKIRDENKKICNENSKIKKEISLYREKK